ncbi:hypothetical protein [uncultured Paraglaciecola sp.]|uniref:hypothetical protein n=1 Tax=uncultured Paraglaciecola sp. TaxID=1765024 RepID=UPI002601FCD5|nr:hypothetical protein [uncultured Paraglaciecola sp.]
MSKVQLRRFGSATVVDHSDVSDVIKVLEDLGHSPDVVFMEDEPDFIDEIVWEDEETPMRLTVGDWIVVIGDHYLIMTDEDFYTHFKHVVFG